MLTRRCPVTCAHCGTGSHPHSGPDLDPVWAKAAIRDAAIQGLRVVNFSGGEPLLRPRVLVDLIRFARGHGLLTRVTTSGVWATTSQQARDLARQLARAGLQQLFLSVDAFHARHIPGRHVRQAAVAAWNLGLQVVAAGIDDGEPGEGHHPSLEPFVEHGLPRPPLTLQPLVPAGRAAAPPPNRAAMKPWKELAGPCGALGQHPTLHADGTWTGCASLVAPSCPELSVARRHAGGLQAVGRRLIDDPLWTWIAGFGPAGLRVLLGNGNDERSGCPPIRLPARATGICHLCVALLGRKEVVRQARRLLGGHPRRR